MQTTTVQQSTMTSIIKRLIFLWYKRSLKSAATTLSHEGAIQGTFARRDDKASELMHFCLCMCFPFFFCGQFRSKSPKSPLMALMAKRLSKLPLLPRCESARGTQPSLSRLLIAGLVPQFQTHRRARTACSVLDQLRVIIQTLTEH